MPKTVHKKAAPNAAVTLNNFRWCPGKGFCLCLKYWLSTPQTPPTRKTAPRIAKKKTGSTRSEGIPPWRNDRSRGERDAAPKAAVNPYSNAGSFTMSPERQTRTFWILDFYECRLKLSLASRDSKKTWISSYSIICVIMVRLIGPRYVDDQSIK